MPGPAFRAAAGAAGALPGAAWDWTETPLDSSALGPADWGRLAHWALAHPGPAVILHGTDTLAHSAAALAFLLVLWGAEGRPVARNGETVVLTGSQRPLLGADGAPDPCSDALANLALAAGTAAAGAPGVTIAFGGRRVAGATAEKVSTLADDAFAAPNGAAAPPDLAAATSSALAAQLAALVPHLGARPVLALAATPGGGAALADAAHAAMDRLGPRLGALHLLGFGLGTWPDAPAWTPVLARAEEAGCLVALSSQVPHGPVAPTRYGAGAWLERAGAVPTGAMTRAAAQAKIEVVLALAAALGWDLATARRALRTPVAGEIVD